MKTKEAILEESIGDTTGYPEYEFNWTQRAAAYTAMDSWAKQQAIAFARAVLNTQWNIQSTLSGSPYLSDEQMYDGFVDNQNRKDDITH